MSLNVFKATFERVLHERLRAYPYSFFISLLASAFYLDLGAWLMYHFLFQKHLTASFIATTGSSDYMSYIIVGSIIYQFIVRTCLNVSRSLITELRQGTLHSLMLAPFKREAYFLGNMSLQVFTTSLETVFAVIIGLFFGLQVHLANPIDILLGLLLSLYAMFALSLVLGGIMLYTRDTYISQNTLFALIFLTCGISFPKELLPKYIQLLASCLPVIDVSELMRTVLLRQGNILSHTQQIIHLLIVSTIYLVVGFQTIKKAERNALEKMEG